MSIEGLVLEINSKPGAGEDAALGTVDWRVRVGSVVGGGGRSAGAVVEAEFLPLSKMLPTSEFIQSFLQSLLPPNRAEGLTIPRISDQLWEEVVPRSGADWARMIEQRSCRRRAVPREQKSTFDWIEEEEVLSGEEEVADLPEPLNADSDDDDEDLPLLQNAAGLPQTQPKKDSRDESVKLAFQGLRADTHPQGWDGVERGRRVAFSYVQMLRAEGII